jgi:hypothetical protein
VESVKFLGFLGAAGLVFIGGISAGIGGMVKNGGFARGCSDWSESVRVVFVKFFVGWDWWRGCVIVRRVAGV